MSTYRVVALHRHATFIHSRQVRSDSWFHTTVLVALLSVTAPLAMSQTQNVPEGISANAGFETRIAELEKQLASMKQPPDVEPAADCCCEVCDDCCSSPGLTGGAELTFLKAQNSIFSFNFLNGAGNQTVNSEFHVEPAARVWVGYQADDTTGWRATYWRVTPDEPATQQINPLRENIEAQTVDFEQLFSRTWCDTLVQFTAGARYAKYEDHLIRFNGDRINHEFEGAGASLGVWAERRFGSCGFSVVGGLRGSFLFGANAYEQIGVAPAQISRLDRDNRVQIYDAKLGIQWNQDLTSGPRCFTRIAFENQDWNLPRVHADMQSNDIGFIGGTIAVGFDR